jgi:hypothetical protein
VDHVPKIENAADRLTTRIHQQVGSVTVAVDGLAAQTAQSGQTAAKGVCNPVHRLPQRRSLNVPAEFRQFRQAPHVPRQTPIQ